jgi:hypothetical protein
MVSQGKNRLNRIAPCARQVLPGCRSSRDNGGIAERERDMMVYGLQIIVTQDERHALGATAG